MCFFALIYRSYILLLGWFVRAIWSLLLRSTIAINADGWRRVSAMAAARGLRMVGALAHDGARAAGVDRQPDARH